MSEADTDPLDDEIEPVEVDKDVDDLYGLPLEEFTPARNGLAKRRRAAGDRAGAEAIQKLRKPSVAAWGLNQLARSAPSAIEELRQAGETLRAAHSQALAGDASALREATRAEQEAVSGLARRAAAVISGAGGAGDAQLERLQETLRVAATEPDAFAALCAGRLIRDLEASGISWADTALAVGPPASATPPAGPSSPKAAENGAADQDGARRAAAAKRKAARLRKAADEAAAKLTRLDEEAERAEAAAQAARARADDARADAKRAADAARDAEAEAG